VTLRQIAYFMAVFEHGSFRKAADRLGVTQPTLTAQIGSMEQTLGVMLFERSHSGVLPTPAANELISHARRIDEEVQGFSDIAAGLSGHGGGTYRLGVTPTLGPYLLPYLLPDLHKGHESLRLYVREDTPADLERALKSGSYDLILSTQPIAAAELDVQPLFREPLKLVLPVDHPLAGKKNINRSDLFGEAVLTIDEHHLFHRQISDLCEELGASVRREYEGTSLDTVRQMVVMGMGITFLPSLYVASEIRETTSLRVTDVTGVQMSRQHALAWRSRSPMRGFFRSLAEDMRTIVRKRLQQHVHLV
jgi:LysR family hydrogen peroxide-inducible transcriptional activator